MVGKCGEMRKETVKTTFGLFMVLLHACAILAVIGLGRSYLEFDEVVSVVLIMVPIFTFHTTSIVKDFVRTQASRGRGEKVNFRYVFIVFLFPVCFALTLAFLIWGFMDGFVKTIDQLKMGIGFAESAFGVYLGLLTKDLFPDTPTTS
jgi:hypothetical protein